MSGRFDVRRGKEYVHEDRIVESPLPGRHTQPNLVENGSVSRPIPEYHEKDRKGECWSYSVVERLVSDDDWARDECNGEGPVNDVEDSRPYGDTLYVLE